MLLAASTHGYWNLQSFWFLLIGVLWIGYFVLEGFDFGVGILQRFVGANEAERGTLRAHDRPGLGRQRGLAARRRRRDVRRVPGLVRDAVLRLLSRAVPRARRADRPRRRDRVPQQAARTRSGATRWDTMLAVSSAVPALLWGVAFADFVHGVPIDAHGTFTGNLLNLLVPYALLGGLTTLALFTFHGALFLTLRVDGRARARVRGAPALCDWRPSRRCSCSRSSSGRTSTPCTRTTRASFPVSSRSPRSCCRSSPARSLRAGRAALRVRGDRALDRADLRHAVPQPLSARARLEHQQRVQPDDLLDELDALHAHGDVDRRARPDAGRAALPDLDVLGVPRAARRRERRGRLAARPDRAVAARAPAPRRRRCARSTRGSCGRFPPPAGTSSRAACSRSSRPRRSSPRRRCSVDIVARRVPRACGRSTRSKRPLVALAAVSVARGLARLGVRERRRARRRRRRSRRCARGCSRSSCGRAPAGSARCRPARSPVRRSTAPTRSSRTSRVSCRSSCSARSSRRCCSSWVALHDLTSAIVLPARCR